MVLYSIETRAKPKQAWGLYYIQRPRGRSFHPRPVCLFCPLTALFYYFCAAFCPSPAEGLRRHQQLIYKTPPTPYLRPLLVPWSGLTYTPPTDMERPTQKTRLPRAPEMWFRQLAEGCLNPQTPCGSQCRCQPTSTVMLQQPLTAGWCDKPLHFCLRLVRLWETVK